MVNQHNWEERKEEYANTGTRTNLSKNIEITSEMEDAYNESKKKVVKNAKMAIVLIILFLVLRVEVSPNLVVGKIVIVGILAAIILLMYFVGSSRVKDVEGHYVENCIEPLANQISPDMIVRRHLESFPLYGDVSLGAFPLENSPLRAFAERAVTDASKSRLGDFLESKCVVPVHNYSFKTSFVLDTLSTNREGFLFTNATAYSKSDDSKVLKFKGPIVAMRMSHSVRSGVSLYTSKTSAILKREGSNGFKRVDSIDTENEDFNRNFEVTAVEDSQAFFILSPLVMEKLMALKEKYGSFGMYIEEDYMIFGFDINRHILGMPEKLGAAKKMNIEDTAKELVELLDMMYDFKDAVDLNFDTQM